MRMRDLSSTRRISDRARERGDMRSLPPPAGQVQIDNAPRYLARRRHRQFGRGRGGLPPALPRKIRRFATGWQGPFEIEPMKAQVRSPFAAALWPRRCCPAGVSSRQGRAMRWRCCRQWPMRGVMPIRIRRSVGLGGAHLQLARAHLLRLLQRCRFAWKKFRFALALAADVDPHRIRASDAPRLGALLTKPIRPVLSQHLAHDVPGRWYQKTVD